MALTVEQIKGRIRNVAKENNADARSLLHIYMMERFLERIANSPYASDFIIKGGILVTSMVGVGMRSTIDIDTTIRNFTLSEEEIHRKITEISKVDLQDGISFSITGTEHIMNNMKYPGIRIMLEATYGKMSVPLKIDVSTGDIITPRAIAYQYKLMLENRNISLLAYNLETILSEKLQTTLVRRELNTRMRDYYDVCILMELYAEQIDQDILSKAFAATCKKRDSDYLMSDGLKSIDAIETDADLRTKWRMYQKKYSFARKYDFDTVIRSVRALYMLIRK